ncbi:MULTISPECIES: hypothetical protein [Moorena]|uniref:Uncharacterized protein n=1 Tax=Moorena producens (strain JHB) TaxID=1454205 RepID=A0A9Q9UVC7_MOOP1|nr:MULTISPECIES: hypothetical protein [Moorena]NEQ16897.1 hypothetical protein [Moorena sp. SIO3E2]NEP65784.1 hypothetical protein [Moorena sp. SIO3A5]NEQ06523.1 hypothetical protein [Moorena sp. SIO4E2]NER88409.1 hypothetical protein [Moorena sp. SIO3A2]NES40387.1 hypothetical protein [Moorena sp. SIO2C4]
MLDEVQSIFFPRLPRCAFRRRIKFATGRTAPDSRFPFPSWEGLGVGSDSLLPTP